MATISKPYLIALFSLIAPISFAESARDQDFDYLLSLPFKSLMDLQISVASNIEQTIVEAPLVISRYNRADLEKMGVSSLRQMLEFVPGLLIQNAKSGHSSIMSRGLVASYNQKVLFLLDEVPYRAPSHAELPLDGIPFESISHIEVVRGPAAVHYGSNASAAVINIVTLDNQASRINVSGNGNLVKGGARIQGKGEFWWANLSVEKQNDDGHDARIERFSPARGLPDSGNFNQGIDKESFLLRGGYKNLTFMAQAFETTFNDDNGPSPFLLVDGQHYKGQLYHLAYEPSFSSSSLKVFADYNQFDIKIPIQNALGLGNEGGFRFEDGNDNKRWRVGIEGTQAVNSQFSLMLGYEYEHLAASDQFFYNAETNQDLVVVVPGNTNRVQALYAQADYFYQKMRYTLGGRYIKDRNNKNHFAPQLAAVYQLSQNDSIKLLLAQGFSSPTLQQQGINLKPELQGIADIDVEKINTIDLAYTSVDNQRLFSANLFYIKARDLIQRVVLDETVRTTNSGGSTRFGVELDFQVYKHEWTWLSNWSYLHQGNDKDEDLSSLVTPKFLATLGLSYDFNRHTLGGSVKYVSERAAANEYALVDLAYQYKWENFSIYSNIHNLLNKEIASADVQELSPVMQIKDTSGAQLSVGFRYDFQ